eukprot:tig00020556_g10996.t1
MAASEKGGRAMSTVSMRRGTAPGAPALGQGETKLSRKLIEDGIFSVLYALRPMGNPSRRLAIIALACEYIQIMSFALDPLSFGWQHPPYVGEVIDVLTTIFPIRFLDKMGYGSLGIVFGLLLAIVCGAIAAGGWIFARKGKFRYRWPLRLLRATSNLLFSTLYLSCMAILLRPLDCRYLENGTAAPTPYRHAIYSNLECWGMPNGVTSIAAIVGIVLYYCVASLRTLLNCDPNCGTESLLAYATFHTPFRSLAWRFAIAFTGTFLSGYPGLTGILLALESSYLVYLYVRFLPTYSALTSAAYAGIYTAFCWTSLVAAAQAIAGGLYPVLFSIAFLLGQPVAFAACYFLVRARHRRLCNPEYVGLNDDGQYVFYRDLGAPYHTEIAARFVREARNKKNDDLDQDLVDRAECVYQEGLRKFPKHAAVYLAFSNYLKVFKGSAQLEATFVDRSRHLQLDVQERFAVFRKDREKEQSSTGDLGEQAMDLASYVEFQKQFKAAKEGHLKTVKAMRLFWHTLLEDDETAFSKMPRRVAGAQEIFRLVDAHESVAEKNYVALLQKYPRSVRVLRAFGSFIEQVKNDALVAEDYYRMADAEEEEISRRNAESTGREDAVQSGAIDNSRNGVVIMGSNEIITSVNAIACRMWGYKRNEMVGKRITLLMPSPFKDDHHIYVSSYLRTGVAKVVNIPRSVYGIHRDGYIFPIKLYVTRMDLNGVITFVGAITPVETDKGIMLVNAGGRVTACNKEAASLFEMGIEELTARDVKVLVPPRFWSVFDAGVQQGGAFRASASTNRSGLFANKGSFRTQRAGVPPSHNSLTGRRPSHSGSQAPSQAARSANGGAETALTYSSKIMELIETEIQGLSKDGSVFPLHVKITKMFEGEKTLLAVTMTEVEDTDALLSIDVRGIIRSCNKHACVMFGYTPVELINQKIETLMPAPYSTYHHTYLERYLRTGEAHVIGAKRSVDGKHKSGSTFGIVLDISRVDVSNEIIFVGRITRQNEDETDAMITINQEGIIQNCNAACSTMWGYRTSEMVGRNVKMLMPPQYAVNHDGYLSTYMKTRKANVIGTGGRSLEGLHQDGSVFPIQLEVMEDTTLTSQGVTLFNGRVAKLTDMDALITITKEGIVKSCNRNLCRMFGIKATEDLVGRNVKVLMPPEIAVRHDDILRNYLETGVQKVIGKKRTLNGRHTDGREFPLTLEVSEVKVSGDVYFSARILFNADAEKDGGVMFATGGAAAAAPKAAASLEGAAASAGPKPALKGAAGAGARGAGRGEGEDGPAPPRGGGKGAGGGAAAPAAGAGGAHGALEAISEGEDEFVLSLAPVSGPGAPLFNFSDTPTGSAASTQTGGELMLAPGPRPASSSSSASHGSRHRHLIDPLDLNRRPDLSKRRNSAGAGSNTARSADPETARSESDAGSGAGSARDAAADDRIRNFLQSARRAAEGPAAESPREKPKLASIGSQKSGADGSAAGAGAGTGAGSVHGSQTGGSVHGSQHDGGSEAGHSQASSATSKKRRRRKRMELLAAAARRNSGVELLWRNIIISVACLGLLAVGAFVAVQQILTEYSTSIHSIAAGGERALSAQLIVMETRSLDVAARRAVPAGSGARWNGLPTVLIANATDERAVNATAEMLKHEAALLNKQHLALALGTDGLKAPAAGPLRELMEQPVLALSEFVDTVPPRVTTANMSLWTAGEKFVQGAHLVANSAQFVVAGATSVAGLSPAEPARCLYNPTTCRPLQYLLRNGPDAVTDAMERAVEAYASEVVTSQAVVRTVYVVTLGISLAVILTLAFLVFKPTLERVRHERDAIMALFLHIPKAAVKIQAQRKIVVKMESDEETDDEDDEEEGGPSGGQAAAGEEPAPRKGISFGADTREGAPEREAPAKARHGPRRNSRGEASGSAAGVGGRRNSRGHAHPHTAAGEGEGPAPPRGLLARLFGGRGAAARYAAPRGADRMFRSLSVQYLAALGVCMVFFIAIFVAGFSLVQRFNDDSAEIKLASYRVVRSMHLLHLVREFVLDQSLFPAVTPQLRARIASDVARLRREHGLLVRGGGVRSYGPLAELTFRATCLRKDRAECLGSGDINYPSVSNGLDTLMNFFFDQVDLLLADAEADKRAALPSTAQGPADGAANARFRTVWNLGRADVFEGLVSAVTLYEEARHALSPLLLGPPTRNLIEFLMWNLAISYTLRGGAQWTRFG